MSQLELIWELENHYNLLDNHIENLDILDRNLNLKKLEEEYSKNEQGIHTLKAKIKENKKELNEGIRFLNICDFKVKEIDTNLYDGKINDIKQINYLISEKDKLKRQIEDVETKALTLMEENDYLEKEYLSSLDKLGRITNDINEIKKSNDFMKKDLKNKIENEKVEIKRCEDKIDKNLLDRYQILKKNKKNGIVKVRNYVCGGCNMMVSTHIREKLQQKKEVVFCEYCNRILYFTEDE